MVKELGKKIIAQNKKARHDYSIEEVFECGIALSGTEVKSLPGVLRCIGHNRGIRGCGGCAGGTSARSADPGSATARPAWAPLR